MEAEEFLKLIKTSEGCSNWPKGTTPDGYGSVRFKGETWRANRLAYTLTKGVIPEGMGVLHKCDNKLCINPDHLYLGTQKDNVKDLMERGQIGTSKLKREEVVSILKSHFIDKKSGAYLSRLYKVSQAAISAITKGRHYPDIFAEVTSELLNKVDR
jgi:hypothetical protein